MTEHVTTLRAAGMGYRAIALDAGLHVATVRSATGPSRATVRGDKGVRWATAYKILRVELNQRRGLDSTGMTRRLRALRAIGYTTAALGRELGSFQSHVDQLTRAPFPTADRHLVERVNVLYDRLSMTPGPSARARQIATKHGWAPPLAWDDDTIDDPTASPSGINPVATTGPTRTAGHTAEDVQFLLRTGTAKAEIVVRLGMTEEAIDRALYRAHRADLARWFRTSDPHLEMTQRVTA